MVMNGNYGDFHIGGFTISNWFAPNGPKCNGYEKEPYFDKLCKPYMFSVFLARHLYFKWYMARLSYFKKDNENTICYNETRVCSLYKNRGLCDHLKGKSIFTLKSKNDVMQ